LSNIYSCSFQLYVVDAQVEDSGVYMCTVPQMNLTKRIEVAVISKLNDCWYSIKLQLM
jgi:hypothetical protein